MFASPFCSTFRNRGPTPTITSAKLSYAWLPRLQQTAQRAIICFLLACATQPALMGQRLITLTPTEKLVLTQLQSGAEADLKDAGPADQVLRHNFLELLITGAYTTPALSRHGITISNATVKGLLEVTSAIIPYPVRLKHCNLEAGIDFSYDKFEHDLSLEGSHVGTPSIGQNALAPPQGPALFIGTTVDGLVNLRGAYFHTSANFTYAQVGSEFLSDDVHYESDNVADFDSFKARAPVFFRRSHFAGKLRLADSELFALYIEDPLPPGTIDLELKQAHIQRGLTIKGVTLQPLQAEFLEVAGGTKLEDVTPASQVNLAHSHFQGLTLIGFDKWLRKGAPGDFNLEGLSFDGIDIPDAAVEPHAARMLELINSDRCPYSPQPYMELEKFLRAHGNPNEADQAYIDMRRRERTLLSVWLRPFDWFLDVLVGYGRRAWLAVIYALLLAVAGTAIFRPEFMEHEDKATDTWYNSFWFSLDLLSPIDLGVSKKWRPKENKRWIRNYAQVHRVAGWILIPLILAAITGVIK